MPRTYFWLGEAAYRSGDPNTARIYYNEFLKDATFHTTAGISG